MIYQFPNQNEPIRQGDLFAGVPRIELSLAELSIVNQQNETEAISWEVVRSSDDPVTAIVAVKAVWGIVITQDCDTIRAPDITLCEIRSLADVVRVPLPTTTKKWASFLTQQATVNVKWFYLPPDARVGFEDRMAVDFLSTLRVAGQDLERARHLRRGRLNDVADEHFRERLAEFFRRYPYNEWYPFNKEEFEAYRAARPQEAFVIPYEWQR